MVQKMTKENILDLGLQPIANKFLTYDELKDDEYFFPLTVSYDIKTGLVSLNHLVPPEKMFNEDYVYHSSGSKTMRDHFASTAELLEKRYSPTSVLEIGSNDGAFLKNWDKSVAESVEPCGNFAELTRSLGYKTLTAFWNKETAKELKKTYDLIYSANCFCHIHDLEDAFEAIKASLSKDGILVIEDPSLLKMVERCSYDQLYDEHAHIFSVYAISNIAKKAGLSVVNVDELNIHGGSNRIYIAHTGSVHKRSQKISNALFKEKQEGITSHTGLSDFQNRVSISMKKLRELLYGFKKEGHKIISYGATSKSTTVFNYCSLGVDIFDYIIDTTPDKIGKYSPGKHIPVIKYEGSIPEDVTIAFLGAWNFEKEILEKEQAFLERGGKFVTHIPETRVIENRSVTSEV